ncbi:MAG TPA: exodeoxyribonuclease VII small subunit [Candidatus Eisenbacteria bacterium]|nr:exodeoxyribonuclease VII small subunit [Candidatus Eisenbacteria bacterium]
MKRTTAGGPGSGAGAEEPKSFESMMERLEALVEKLEGGNLSLEESIKSFEEGMGLVKQCSSVLQEAEQRIQKLTRDAEGKPAVESSGRSRRSEEDADGELPF